MSTSALRPEPPAAHSLAAPSLDSEGEGSRAQVSTQLSSAPIPESFAAECAQHLDQVWRQLRTMGVAVSYLDDATQEVFLIAHKKWSLFEGRAQVSTWLYAIAYRVGCNYRRKAKRDQVSAQLETEHRATGPDPEQSLLNKQAGHLVQEFCDSLSEKLRDVFVLCLIEERSVAEVALLLETPENTIYSRIRLVREAFRQKLQPGRAQP